MPLYEYQCQKCSHRFEKIMKFSDPAVKKCPQCGGKVEQMISAPAVQFKGSGWYVTDYAKKSGSGASGRDGGLSSESSGDSSGDSASKATEKAESPGSKAEAGGSESKSENKSESKSESKEKPEKTEKRSDSKKAKR